MPDKHQEISFTLASEEAQLLLTSIDLAHASAQAQVFDAMREIANPSLFNPQPELWAQRQAEAQAVATRYEEIRDRLREELGLEPLPQVIVMQTEPQVTGPAETNRPPSGKPGAKASGNGQP